MKKSSRKLSPPKTSKRQTRTSAVTGRKETYTLELKSDPKEIRKVEPFLEEVNRHIQLDDGTFYRLLVASTEAVNNAILHGNKSDPKKKVWLICHVNNDSIVVTVRDQGKGFKPESVPDPLQEENLMKESGRGLFLMKSLMDGVEYTITPKGTVVELKINLKLLK